MPIVLLVVVAAVAAPLDAQQWSSPEAQVVVDQAVRRRSNVPGGEALQSYRAHAHGFVFFSTQIGEALNEPPRLIKADELDVEVYWQTPAMSKQVVTAWRDRRFLPTDISYHSDHLRVVLGNLPNRITLGDGNEVRGVLHPFAPDGPSQYEYAIADSISLATDQRTLRLVGIDFRPIDTDAGLAVGRAYLDRATGDIVRLRLGFTAAAYRDEAVEDITLLLENSLTNGEFWLPVRQEIEIRRRVAWFDFPARTLIRVRWAITDLDPNIVIDPTVFGRGAGGITAPDDSSGTWQQTLEEAAADAAKPLTEQDLQDVRLEVQRLVGPEALQTLRGARLGTNSVSDLALVNRVQGLRLGVGGTVGLPGVELKGWVGYGTSDSRGLGRLSLRTGVVGGGLKVEAYRQVRDLSDLQVISTTLNSLRSQEAGIDLGDYVLLGGLSAEMRWPVTNRTALTLGVAVENSTSVTTEATPIRGTYRANPPLGAGDYGIASVVLERMYGGMERKGDLYGNLRLEAGEGPNSYLRSTATGTGRTAVGHSTLLARAYVGWGTDGLPAYRSFVLGGRGTLPGEPYRAYGGRSMAWVHVEWRSTVAIPAVRLGSFASTGSGLVLAPFVAAGWSDRSIAGTPWRSTDGVRPVAGVAMEWLMQLLRLEVGVGLLDGGVQVTLDVTRAWWPLL
jgi:hypothetical protein